MSNGTKSVIGQVTLVSNSFVLTSFPEREAFGASATEGSGERHFVSVPTYPKFEVTKPCPFSLDLCLGNSTV